MIVCEQELHCTLPYCSTYVYMKLNSDGNKAKSLDESTTSGVQQEDVNEPYNGFNGYLGS